MNFMTFQVENFIIYFIVNNNVWNTIIKCASYQSVAFIAAVTPLLHNKVAFKTSSKPYYTMNILFVNGHSLARNAHTHTHSNEDWRWVGSVQLSLINTIGKIYTKMRIVYYLFSKFFPCIYLSIYFWVLSTIWPHFAAIAK